jgi:hypothetical protein
VNRCGEIDIYVVYVLSHVGISILPTIGYCSSVIWFWYYLYYDDYYYCYYYYYYISVIYIYRTFALVVKTFSAREYK